MGLGILKIIVNLYEYINVVLFVYNLQKNDKTKFVHEFYIIKYYKLTKEKSLEILPPLLFTTPLIGTSAMPRAKKGQLQYV